MQKELREIRGVSALIFDQTCAAEKRRRRKRNLAPPPQKRVMIHDRVCEGCGDCSRQSNCVSIEPLETPFGTKRRVNQSSCNQDLSCTEGFCPSFVLIEGGEPQKRTMPLDDIMSAAADLPSPVRPSDASADILLPGIGGTGVTTLSAVLAMAGHLDGLQVASSDMTGLAQKGGMVLSFLRFAPADRPIHGAKIQPGSADLVIGCDLLVTAAAESLALCSPERTTVIAERAVAPTGRFALFQEAMEGAGALEARVRRVARSVNVLDAGDVAEALFGDRIFANMMLTGAAFQEGALPLALASIEEAIRLNGVAAERNMAAFHAGRLIAAAPERLPLDGDAREADDEGLEALVERLAAELVAYQDTRLAVRFLGVVEKVKRVEAAVAGGRSVLSETVARNLFKLMAYKDEYEVARLYSDPAFREKVAAEFGEGARLSVQLAPPLLSRIDPDTGRPRKMTFGPWIFPLFSGLARLKGLRGTWFDPFGWTAERRMERRLIDGYIVLIERILQSLADGNYDKAVALAALPEEVSGFGPVKAAKVEAARAKEEKLMAAFEEVGRMSAAQSEEAWQIAAE